MKRLADESRADEKMVVSLWKHETERVIKDRISRFADIKWYDEKMDEILDEVLHTIFCPLPVKIEPFKDLPPCQIQLRKLMC